ncbi:glycosyltransferase family 2 protein [Spirosoma sp. KCTC 42546]|uniref:glycosyltransferase family A protein n=1 Tax=Spirosoma sp. KCTC 42546 TaxID=2520506 RepID=UPI00115705EB|nr:glycosyltransferase family A protein [Spirosoma sp. KCTC 42546]QDK79579.1 glycosyltransferase family 2 protein [Spirosoma sp. KCTC 42546]
MNESILATIILPTTADRGILLPLCVGSIQRQTLQAFELFIIGDGVDEGTRAVILDLMREDGRIHFFDHPKHPRRGELYRHQALQQARGFFVAYICDRDLWLSHHLQTLAKHLSTADLVATNYYYVRRNQQLFLPYLPVSPQQATVLSILSAAGHRLDFYKKLPYGWRTTPVNRPTDLYMWEQIIAQPNCRFAIAWQPTLLYFKRNDHPGWPTAQRYEELARWTAIMQTPVELQSAIDQALASLFCERNQFKRSWILVRGKRLSDLPDWLRGKVQRWLKRPSDPSAEESWLPDPIESDR